LDQAEYAEAEEYFSKSLQIVLKRSGENSGKVAAMYNNLGNYKYIKSEIYKNT
jgi:hypothetical protein